MVNNPICHLSLFFISESSSGDSGEVTDLDEQSTIDNNSTDDTENTDDNLDTSYLESTSGTSVTVSACSQESPLTNLAEREIVTAILEALNLVDQMQGSQKDFLDVLEFAEKLYFRNNDGEDSVKCMWPKTWGETEILFKKMWVQ